MIELNLRPSPSQVRWFGALWLPASLIAPGTLALLRWNLPALGWTLLLVAFASEAAVWTAPVLIRPALVTLNIVTWPLAWLTQHALLAAIWFGLIFPIGLVRRWLDRRPARSASYWIERGPTPEVERYLRPY